MRSALALAATIAVASATNYKPCGNLCADGTAPTDTITTENGNKYAVCLNTDFAGADLSTDQGGFIQGLDPAGDLQELAEQCSLTEGCIAATQNTQFGYLKNGVPVPYGTTSNKGDNSIFQIMCDDGSATTTTTTAAQTTTTAAQTTTTAAQTTTTAAQTTTTAAQTTTTAAQTTTTAAQTTTTKVSTTTSASGPGPTPPVSCPKDDDDIVESGGRYFYKFWSGKCKRNSFAYSHFTTFPKSLSEEDATQKCADWIAAKPRSEFPLNFQIFQYKDNTWHCDATRTLNTDLNFKSSNDVDKMIQYNPLPDNCKPSTPTPPQTCPDKKTIVTSNCGKTPASYSLFWYGKQKRNSFKVACSEYYSQKTSYDTAIQRCANFVSKQLPNVAQTFQVYYNNKSCKWTCDAGAVENKDSNFSYAKDIKILFQFNAVPKNCSYKRDIFSSNQKRTYYQC